MTARLNKFFPINTASYDAWKDKTVDELLAIQAKLINKMSNLDGHTSSKLYQQFENTLAQLDLMIEKKQQEAQEKENVKPHQDYNQRRD